MKNITILFLLLSILLSCTDSRSKEQKSSSETEEEPASSDTKEEPALSERELTALYLDAASKDELELLIKYLEEGAWPEGKDSNGDTALILAIRNDADKVFEYLIQDNKHIENRNTSKNQSALAVAIELNRHSKVNDLLERIITIEKEDIEGLLRYLQTQNRQNDLVKLIQNKRIELSDDLYKSLLNTHDPTFVDFAFEQPVYKKRINEIYKSDPYSPLETYLDHVMDSEQTDLIPIVVKHGGLTVEQIEEKFTSIIKETSILEDKETFEKLLSDFEDLSDMFIRMAIKFGSIDLVKYLFEEKMFDPDANIAMVYPGSFSPLAVAVRYGRAEIVEYMINELDVPISGFDDSCMTPIMLASEKGHFAIVKFLFEKGAKLNEFLSLVGKSPVDYASENGHQEIYEYLVEKGGKNGKVLKSEGASTPCSG